MKIGVLAVQGNFREHAAMLGRLGADPVEVRKPEQLQGLDGLVIPGGESTTFMRLMRLYGLDAALAEFAAPVFGTCAGMIVLDRNHLGLVDVSVRRNAFGRQVASFETDLDVSGIDSPVRAVCIRAPWVEDVGGGVEGRARGTLPRCRVSSGADRRRSAARTVFGPRQGGAECPGIASGRRSSTRRAPQTRSAASSSRSSRARSSSRRRRAAATPRTTSRS